MATTHNDIHNWRGQNMMDAGDDKIGKIEEIYVDTGTDAPEWALVTTGMFGTKQSFVPIEGATERKDGIHVAFEKATVKDAPKVDPEGALSPAEEDELYRHYGREPRGASTEDRALTTAERETGRVRLKKYVMEDQAVRPGNPRS